MLSSKGIEPFTAINQFFYREPPLPIGSPALNFYIYYYLIIDLAFGLDLLILYYYIIIVITAPACGCHPSLWGCTANGCCTSHRAGAAAQTFLLIAYNLSFKKNKL